LRAGIRDRFYLSRHSIEPPELGIEVDQEKTTSNSLRFGYLGNLISGKGVDLLAAAYARLSAEYGDVSLAIWGSAEGQLSYHAQLRDALDGVPGVYFCGKYQPSQVGDILRNVDVLVVPSRWPEIGPFVVLEGLAARTPIIGTRLGNIPELVQHDVNGLLFELDSVPELYAQMRRLVMEPSLLASLRAGILPVRTTDDEMNDLLDVYSLVTSCGQQAFNCNGL
jgi:glycosyltransferase involved in cell wall biosynthesis